MYLEYTQLCIKMGDKPSSLFYFNKYDSLSRLIFNEESNKSINVIKTEFDTEKKEKENELLQIENKLSTATIKQQRLVTFFILGGLLIVILLAFFIFNGLKKQRKANIIISEQKQEVETQKHLVEEKQKEILDSIHYAKRIQTTLLAHSDFINENLKNNFVLFKPKDIVSGDFYWAAKKNHLFYLAICDSTGHGVPGAFMSLLNIGFLSEAINEKGIEKPNEVFNYVRDRLINSISKEGQQDGFDGILLCFNQKTNKITYAAAHNAPVIISNNEIIQLEADKMPVGKGERKEDFGLFEVNLKSSETLYAYTDGYADQFGGEKGKKFMYKKLNQLLLSNSSQLLNSQKEILIQLLKNGEVI